LAKIEQALAAVAQGAIPYSIPFGNSSSSRSGYTTNSSQDIHLMFFITLQSQQPKLILKEIVPEDL